MKQPSLRKDKLIQKLIEIGRIRVYPETGEVFSNHYNARHGGVLGKSLGRLCKGYVKTNINYNGKVYQIYVHRIIYIAVNGIPPKRKTIHRPS